jgi:hypothetical protein
MEDIRTRQSSAATFCNLLSVEANHASILEEVRPSFIATSSHFEWGGVSRGGVQRAGMRTAADAYNCVPT